MDQLEAIAEIVRRMPPGAVFSFSVTTPQAARAEALEHLRRMVEAGAIIGSFDGVCHYCKGWPAAGEPHKDDCAFVAAEAFLASLTPPETAP